MSPEEFDINFDFDKIYGDDSQTDKCSFDDDFDLDAALERELGPDFDRLFEEEYAAAQAALNAQAEAEKEDMDATRIRLAIGHEDREDFEEPVEEEDEEEADAPREAPEVRKDPIFGFIDFDEEEEAEPDDADEDLSAIFAAVTANRESFFEEEPEPFVEEEHEEPATEKEDRKSKVNLADVKAKLAPFGAAVKDNAQRFTSALKECKPGKMDRKAKRRFKDDVLPVLIGGAALIVCMVFVIGSLSRNYNSEDRKQAALEASIAQAEAEAAAAAEIRNTLETAAAQAASYDYQGAIDTLDAYKTAERGLTEEMAAARAEYVRVVNTLVVWDDPAAIPNLSFHVLIADPNRAYADALASSYKSNFVTTEQFSDILDQLYAGGYVLVNLDSCLTETADGSVTVQPIYLPEGKKPIMITETLVNYFAYMVDSDRDGTPDKGGAGFANKLVLKGGKVQADYVDADGNQDTGDYDLVPILNAFIEAHPDFSYRGAKAILAVTGEEGVFGYRNAADAAEVVAALREDGYQIASNSYANLNYGSTSMEEINGDLTKWKNNVATVLGDVDILVVARGGEMPTGTTRFQTVRDAGFRYILDAGTGGTVLQDGCFYQNRIMVLGSLLGSSSYAEYFTLAN
ncbi:MAG: hypothetical protein IKY17_07750 [Oscillospiraceae bacterium]|nr:hypothetical protein [Oscillospiraceae bacterium]